MSKAKRRMVNDNTRRMSGGGARGAADFPDFDLNFDQFVQTRTTAERDSLARLTKANFLFQHLIPEQLERLYSVFSKVEVKAGDVVIKQGDQGDKFYVVQSGEYEVTVTAEDKTVHLVMVYNQGGSSFGELSLMYGKPRAATVTATADGVVWALARPAFKAMLVRKIGFSHTNLIKILKKVDILNQLPVPQLQRLCDVLGERTFKDGENIVTQGEKGEGSHQFFIIGSGECACTETDVNSPTKAEKEIHRLKENDYFGDRSLLMDEARAFSATCVGATSVFVLERSKFLEVVGGGTHLHELIARDQEKKDAMRQAQSTTTTHYTIAKHTIQGVSYAELDFQSWACKYDYGFLGCYVHKRQGSDRSLALQMYTVYTVKVVSKSKAIEQTIDDQIVQDRDIHNILALITRPSPFVPVILASFSDPKCVYSVYKGTVVCQLSEILSTVNDFDATAALFYTSCVIMALEFLHDEGVMHRRVTPECVWITSQGYAQLGDLGCAKEMTGQNQFTMCGDPSYLAPEQVTTRGHTHTVDFWSLGVLIFEMLTGDLPFGDSETPETELYKNISSHEYDRDIFENCPNYATISHAAMDLVKNLLRPEGGKRIGAGTKGVDEIKEHSWVSSTNWNDLSQGRVAAPHAVLCSTRVTTNSSNELEKKFVQESPDVEPDDCPEKLQTF